MSEQAAQIAIRIAAVADAATISALVTEVTRRYVLPDQPAGAAEKLLPWMAADAIAGRIEAGHRHHLAEIDGCLAGVVGTRDDSHVHLLFVDPQFQRRGIARALWQVALDACIASARTQRITVNSSAFAVPVYRRLGFVERGPAQLKDGIVATPMEFAVPRPDAEG